MQNQTPSPTAGPFGVLRNEPETQSFQPGQRIFETGEPGSCLYYVVEGQVDILSDGRLINSLGAGEIFGEMALITEGPRSATAIARTACRTVSVGERRFLFLVQHNPFFALELMRVMADRLRRNSSL